MDEEELSPQQAERVRRLLAGARHTEPMPADVADRLDRVIADLAADPAARPADDTSGTRTDGAGVVRLGERRRKVGRLLLAAAAVVVGGVAVGQVVAGGGGEGDAMSGSDAGSEQGLPAPQRGTLGQGENESGSAPDEDLAESGDVADRKRSISKRPVQLVRSDRFATDARRLRPLAAGRATDGTAAPELATGSYADGCDPGPWGGGRYLRVSFERDAGWLVYRPSRGETQVVDLFLCGEDAAERSVTLPSR